MLSPFIYSVDLSYNPVKIPSLLNLCKVLAFLLWRNFPLFYLINWLTVIYMDGCGEEIQHIHIKLFHYFSLSISFDNYFFLLNKGFFPGDLKLIQFGQLHIQLIHFFPIFLLAQNGDYPARTSWYSPPEFPLFLSLNCMFNRIQCNGSFQNNLPNDSSLGCDPYRTVTTRIHTYTYLAICK